MLLYKYAREQRRPNWLLYPTTTREALEKRCYFRTNQLVYIAIFFILVLYNPVTAEALLPILNTNNFSCSFDSLNSNCTNSISAFISICDKHNQTKNSTQTILRNMHFDFCQEVHPIFTLPYTYNSSSYTFQLTNETKFDVTFECHDLETLLAQDQDAKINFMQLETTLDRLKGCADNETGEGVNCNQCKAIYQKWLCLTAFNIRIDNISNRTMPHLGIREMVCLNCPLLEPDSAYGGYPAFTCLLGDDDDDYFTYIDYSDVNKSRIL